MPESKHTPGPWDKIIKHDGYTSIGADTLIARVFSKVFRDTENEEANARLIASAPELLDALQIAIDELQIAIDELHEQYPQSSIDEGYWPDIKPIMHGLNATLNKAKGIE